jgi:hypothetical protein
VSTRSTRNRVQGLYGDRLKLALKSPPLDGRANSLLCALIAKEAGVAAAAVRIVVGERNRSKTLLVECRDPEAVAERLGRRLAAAIDKKRGGS